MDDNPDLKLDIVPDSKPIRPDLNEHLQMSDEELLICSWRVPGFSIATKKWRFLDVSNLKPVEYNKDAFSSLILPGNLKKTLSSLVTLQKADTSQFDDLIEGKGKGLILLLHGPPGVGKTFTAGKYMRQLVMSLG